MKQIFQHGDMDMALKSGEKNKSGIKIQCAACGYIGDVYEFYISSVHIKFRICPKCGTVRFVCNENKDFRQEKREFQAIVR